MTNMFDDQFQKQPEAPSNLPTEPTDMFDQVEKEPVSIPNALDSGLLKKKEPSQHITIPPNMEMGESKKPIIGKILLAIFGIIGLGGLGYGGWWFYSNYSANSFTINNPISLNTNNEEKEKVENVEVTTNTPTQTNNDSILFGETNVDSDKDDLLDSEEKQLGTNPKNPDTDGDGLSDGDEVKVWHTHPLITDTDSDNFLDGSEILNGYNPNGLGKLTNPPLNIVRFVSSTDFEAGTFTYISQSIKQ